MKRNQAHVNNEIIKKHHETFDEEGKIVIDRNADRVVRGVKTLSNGKAKLGEMGALEILYKLGQLLNEKDRE